ncbi:hypothetical protein D5282_10100 [bacterium 1xD8-48]|nr:hypothetical protein [bacterium 1xD8-48]
MPYLFLFGSHHNEFFHRSAIFLFWTDKSQMDNEFFQIPPKRPNRSTYAQKYYYSFLMARPTQKG